MKKAVENILFVTDRVNEELASILAAGIIPMRELGLKKIISLQPGKANEWLRGLSGQDISWRVIAAEKISASGIKYFAGKENADLIIINNGDNPGFYHENFIKELLDKNKRAVLLLKKNRPGNNENIYTNVVLATDWNTGPVRAFNFISALAPHIKTLDIVHVVNKKLTIMEMRGMRENLTEIRNACRERAINAESHIYAGLTWHEILAAAEDYRATLIVLSNRIAKNGIMNIINRSPAVQVAVRSKIPVMIVPACGHTGGALSS